jgi:protoporphyrinogen oxidase
MPTGQHAGDSMTDHTTDYLIIGAGAVGLAFADSLLDEDPACHITFVDNAVDQTTGTIRVKASLENTGGPVE